MKKKAVSFDEALEALGAQPAPAPRQLRALNGLNAEQLAALQAAWPHLKASRRADVAEKLRELALDDVDLDFTPIFLFGLTDEEESVRLSSVEGLWEYEHPNLIDVLVELLRSDPSQLVRAAGATALGRFLLLGELEKISRRRRDQAYSALMAAILTNPPGSAVYLYALESLAYASNDEVEQLIRESYASENQALRVSAVTAMGRTSDRQFSDIVRRELFNVLPAMRAEAATAAGELEVSEAVPDLARLLEDPDHEVIIAAIGALGQIGGDDSKHILERVVDADDEEIAAAAEEALAEHELMSGNIRFSMSLLDELGLTGLTGDQFDGNKDGLGTTSQEDDG